MADPTRTYFQVDNSVIGGMNGTVTTGQQQQQQQWGATMKPVATANYYPYGGGGGEWKVEDKKPTATKTQMRPMSTVNLSTVDIKHVAQIQIPQTVTQQNNWGGNAPTGTKQSNTERSMLGTLFSTWSILSHSTNSTAMLAKTEKSSSWN